MTVALTSALPVLVLSWACQGGGMSIHSGSTELRVSSVGPSNPLPGYFWMSLGVEGSAYSYSGPFKGGLGPRAPGLPSDRMGPEDEDMWRDPDEDSVCRDAPCYSPDMRVPLLPWTRQDMFGCERRLEQVPAVFAETDELRLTLLPQYGGRVWSVYHKRLRQEMFMRLPALQPADYAMRKAWVSGGIEWNWNAGWCGHTVFTLEPVWAGLVPTERGDMIRVWEFDRINHTTWQVDLLLDGGTLWVHPRIDNPNDQDLNGYWWTNAAQTVTPSGRERVLLPAKYDESHNLWPYGNFFLENVPVGAYAGSEDASNFTGVDGLWQRDMSWIGNRPRGKDTFARLCDKRDADRGSGPEHCAAVPERSPVLPYIAHTLEDGFTTFHGHRGQGTKFFMHNYPQGDNFIQDFMAGVSDGSAQRGYYLEAQTGVAPTQSHVFPLPRRSAVEWSEWFRAFRGSPQRLHAKNYTVALGAVEEWLASDDGMDLKYLEEMEAFLKRHSSTPVSKVLAPGLPWGGLHEQLTGKALAPQIPFRLDLTNLSDRVRAEVRPWDELLRNGSFSAETLSRLPGSFQVAPAWFNRLEASAARGTTWLHELFLGTIALERGHAHESRGRFEHSVRLRKNPHAARNLALLLPPEDAWAQYLTALDAALAWDIADVLRETVLDAVARELTEFAMAVGKQSEWVERVLPRLPRYATLSDQVLLAKARAAVAQGDWRQACSTIEEHCWPLYIQSRLGELVALWWTALQRRYEEAVGRKLRPSELHRMRLRHGVPANIGGRGGSCFDARQSEVVI